MNAMEPRTTGGINLGPSNMEGGHKFCNLTTGDIIVRRKVDRTTSSIRGSSAFGRDIKWPKQCSGNSLSGGEEIPENDDLHQEQERCGQWRNDVVEKRLEMSWEISLRNFFQETEKTKGSTNEKSIDGMLFTMEKRDERIKTRAVADQWTQQHYNDEETYSPMVRLDSL